MRIATWNINSVRLRAPIVLDFLKSHDPDILCLQETKTPDEHFPFKAFKDTPYQHIHIHGMKGYNGVAILSKFPLDEKGSKTPFKDLLLLMIWDSENPFDNLYSI